MTKETLKALIRELVSEELLDEINSAGGPAGAASGDISTPYAFKKSSGNADEEESDRMKSIAKHSMPPQRESNLADENDPAKLNEARSKYRNFKESDEYKNSRSKLSYAVLEMKKMMREVNYLVDVANKLKLEDDIPSDMYWKRTSKDLLEIEKFARSIAKKSRGLK